MSHASQDGGEVRYLPLWVGACLVLIDQRPHTGEERAVQAHDLTAVWGMPDGRLELYLQSGEVLHTVRMHGDQIERFLHTWARARR